MLVEESKNQNEWETFLQSSSYGTFYHSLKWKEVIQRTFHHPALYLTIRDAENKIVGICPGFILNSVQMKVYQSIPYSDYGGPVISENFMKPASTALRSFLQNSRPDKEIAYVKFYFMNEWLEKSFKSPLGYSKESAGLVEVNLKTTPPDYIWNKVFSQNRRRKIRLVERKGFHASEARTLADVRDLYKLYYENMINIGASPYPFEFMENMWRVLYPRNLCIRLIELGDKRVAGTLFFRDSKGSYAAYAGLDRKYHVHGLINYVWWKEIENAQKEGRELVSLGSTPRDPDHHYYVQKMSFGGFFRRQNMLLDPVNVKGCLSLQTRAKTGWVWKNVRSFLPRDLQRFFDKRFSGF